MRSSAFRMSSSRSSRWSGWSSLFFQKLVWRNACLLEYGPQSPFRHIPGMVGDGGKKAAGGVAPDFVAARRISKKLKAKGLEFFDNLAIPKTRQPPHFFMPQSQADIQTGLQRAAGLRLIGLR